MKIAEIFNFDTGDHGEILQSNNWQLSMIYWTVWCSLTQFVWYRIIEKIIISVIFLGSGQNLHPGLMVKYVFPHYGIVGWAQ